MSIRPNGTNYGEEFRWFVGRVIERGTDPLGLNRVKVRCDGVHGTNIKNNPSGYDIIIEISIIVYNAMDLTFSILDLFIKFFSKEKISRKTANMNRE